MIKLLSIFKLAERESGTEYHVKADGFKGGEYDLIFKKRDDARAYKRSLKNSKQNIQASIIRREYIENFITSEKEIY